MIARGFFGIVDFTDELFFISINALISIGSYF